MASLLPSLTRPWRPPGLACLAVLCLLAGCRTREQHLAEANKTAYAIIAEKQPKVPGAPAGFRVETAYSAQGPDTVQPEDIIAGRAGARKHRLTLPEALRLAEENNRNYQRQRESLFLAALALSSERHRYDWQPSAGVSTATERTAGGDTRQTGRLSGGASKLLLGGATLTARAATDLVAYFTGDPRRAASSLLSLDLVAPLWRGAGASIAAESLTQSERQVTYELRNFVRFKQTFAVDVASRYYRMLQQRDTVVNEYNNYQNLVAARRRAEALSGDRLPEFQVDQAKQDELRARNRYILAVEQYQTDVDSFKLLLGIPLGDGLEFDVEPLRQLGRTGVFSLHLGEEDAFAIALESRLDVLTEIDRLSDAKRKVKLAENRLKGDLRLLASTSLPSENDREFERFDRHNLRGSVGLQLDLPLDRVAEANDYRESLIEFERQIRVLELSLDTMRDDLRRGLRSLEQSRKRYQIQTNSVELASRRVESANLLLLAGRAEIRDLLEAQNALLQARNELTATMVEFHLVRLRLMRDLGTVDTDDSGLVETLDLAPFREPPGTPEAPMEEEVIRPEQLFAP